MKNAKWVVPLDKFRFSDQSDWEAEFHRQLHFQNFYRITWLSLVIFLILLPTLYLDINRVESIDLRQLGAARLILYGHLAVFLASGCCFIISKITKFSNPKSILIFHKTIDLGMSYVFFICISFITIGESLINHSITPYIASLIAFVVFVIQPHLKSLFFIMLNSAFLFYLLTVFGQNSIGNTTQKINLIFFSIVAFFISRVVYYQKLKEFKDQKKNEELLVSLKKANDDVKILSGFLPICSYCKKIRDDKGYWGQLEAYIDNHSEAEFSHSICPACMKGHFTGAEIKD